MTGEVIKSFLVGLGFGVDDSSLAKFNKAITTASIKVAALYSSIQVAATGIFYSISKMSEGFENIGYELRLVAPAINKMLILRQAMLSAYRAAGIDLTKVVKQSILFNFSLAKTKFALEAVYKSVGAKFLPMLTKQMDIFRGKIFANMPKIQAALMKFVNFVFKAFEATVQLGARVWSILSRVWEFFSKLDTATDGWSSKILLAIAAWKLLNLEFLATPLGMILTGLLAILALYDDFKVWQEGGESFFNWSKAIPVINAVESALKSLAHVWSNIVDIVLDLVLAMQQLFSGDKAGALDSLKRAGNELIAIFSTLFNLVKPIGAVLGNIGAAIGDKIASVFGFGNAGPNVAGLQQPSPLMPQGSSSNQRVSQETNILVQGSADANSVGRAVANEQSKVNFDMTRNMKGAMR